MKTKYSKSEIEKILLEVSRMISSSLSLNTVTDLVLRESMKTMRANHASLFLIDESMKHLVLEKVMGFSKDEIDNIKLMGSWEVINNQLIKKKKPLIVNNLHNNPLFRNKSLPFSSEKLPISSFLAVPLIKENKIIGVLIVSNRKKSGRIFNSEDKRLMVTLSNHIAIALLNATLYHRLKNLFISTVKSLVRAVDAKDPYTSGHSERVMKYSLAIAKEMGLKGDAMENLGLSSLLHDVGKIGVKESVLLKPGRLSDTELQHIRQHPSIGVKIVETIKDSQNIINCIKDHHERFDGKGYPAHLKGNQISLEGRIAAVADTYDALTTTRPYQKKYSSKEALFEIAQGASSQFDPKVVKAFIVSFSKNHDFWDKR
ncbi:MAG: HD domain-containing phosphohydrolase [Candidatus Omnitrophota bacterium]|jgi:putative nucleotidyltransferase with HDIG domain